MSLRDIIKRPIEVETVVFLFTIFAYIIYSIVMISSRVPFFDEINAWNIAANCDITELADVSKHEGHFILWYLIIKPFAANNIGFAQAMFVINWIFAFLSILIMWFKAPFNPWLKMFITFSFPIQLFSIYARCYSIGIFFLFIICSIYSKRKEKPIIYSSLILLLANTSVICTIAAFLLGILYVFELLIDKKNNRIDTKTLMQPIGIFVICTIIILIQMANFSVPSYSIDKNYLHTIFINFFRISKHWPTNFVIMLQAILLLTGIKFFIKNIKPYLFLIFATALILYIGYNIYVLGCWHYSFLYIFFVAAMWIYLDTNKLETKFQKIYYIVFCILSFSTIFFYKHPWVWNGYHIPLTGYIKENIDFFNNSRIFLYPTDASFVGIVPALEKYNIQFYSPFGTSYKSSETYIRQWGKQKIDFIGLDVVIALNQKPAKQNFIFIANAEKDKPDHEEFLESLKNNKTKLRFKLYKKLNDVIIYYIVVKKNKTVK